MLPTRFPTRSLAFLLLSLLVCCTAVRAAYLFEDDENETLVNGSFADELFAEEALPKILTSPFRTFTGGNNSPSGPNGVSNTPDPQIRILPALYKDGIGQPRDGPNPRAISNAVSSQTGNTEHELGASDWLWQWGQFIDHDMSLTPDDPKQPLPIPIPPGDPVFDPQYTGTKFISFNRSVFASGTGVNSSSPRVPVNKLTAFLDASMVYGSDDARAAALRTGYDGLLKTSTGPDGDYLPFNTGGLANAPDGGKDPKMYVAGDIRPNEQTGLLATHILFVREHNRLARALKKAHPEWNDETLFQTARAIVGAEIQIITYKEFLPLILGPNPLPPYAGYMPGVDPSISVVFSTAAFRLGHTMISANILRVDSCLKPISYGPLPLRRAFFNPSILAKEGGLDPVLRGLAVQRAQRLDLQFVDDIRNLLFKELNAQSDLMALNIQRGRDHGLPTYNFFRWAYGLPVPKTFSDITSDAAVVARLSSIYSSVNDVDVIVGGLAEDHVVGASVGPLFQAILRDQFQRLRDGDRFWYQRVFGGKFLAQLENIRLSTVIRLNTGIGREIDDNVFIWPPVYTPK